MSAPVVWSEPLHFPYLSGENRVPGKTISENVEAGRADLNAIPPSHITYQHAGNNNSLV